MISKNDFVRGYVDISHVFEPPQITENYLSITLYNSHIYKFFIIDIPNTITDKQYEQLIRLSFNAYTSRRILNGISVERFPRASRYDHYYHVEWKQFIDIINSEKILQHDFAG